MKYFLIILLLFTENYIFSQGIKDSIFTIEQVEVSSFFDFIKEEAGMKASRIDSFILNNQVNSNLSSLLSENTTLITKDYGRGALSTASFRGTAPSHTQVSWNGMNINSPMLGLVDFSLIPVFIIDQLDILQGASSVSAQSGGLGGLISIENKPDWNNYTGGKIYLDQGSFKTTNMFAQLNLGNSFIESRTRAYINKSKNDYSFVNKNIIEIDSMNGKIFHPLQKNENAEYEKSGITQEFYIRNPSKWIISNITWYQLANRSVPTILSNEYAEGLMQISNLQKDQSFKNISQFHYYWPETSLQVSSGLDYQNLNYEMSSQVIGFGTSKNIDSKSKMTGWYNHIYLKHKLSRKLSGEVNISFNSYSISTYDLAIQSGYDTLRIESSIFGGLYYTPKELIQFSFQLRKDIASDFTSPLIFVLGANYKPFDSSKLIIKGNFCRNYHNPSLNDLYWQPGGNPELKSEEGYTTELTAMYSMKMDALLLKTSVTGYYSRINDWIMWLPGFKGYWEPFNIKEVMSYGLEYQLETIYTFKKTSIRFFGNLTVSNTLNYGIPLTAGDESYGKQLPYIPKISGNLLASVTNRRYYMIFQNNSMSARYLLSSNSGDVSDFTVASLSGFNSNQFYTMYPHYLNKLTIGRSFIFSFGKLTTELFIDNLFNETYRNILQRFMPGRSYNIHVKYDF